MAYSTPKPQPGERVQHKIWGWLGTVVEDDELFRGSEYVCLTYDHDGKRWVTHRRRLEAKR